MNTQTITKSVVASAAIISLAIIPSCAPMDPEYAEYKRQKQAQAAAAANPYGAPTAETNPYSVPQANGETGVAPYQPIPGVPTDPPVVVNPPAPQPYTPLPPQPSGAASTHTVVKGDTIWGLSRKYSITGDALRQANNLTTDIIWVGQRLIIPTR